MDSVVLVLCLKSQQIKYNHICNMTKVEKVQGKLIIFQGAFDYGAETYFLLNISEENFPSRKYNDNNHKNKSN